MQFSQMLLLLSTFMTLAFSLPTGQNHGNQTDLPYNASKLSNVSIESEPIMVAIEEKSPKFGSVIVEFVYDGNYISDSKVMEKNRYEVGSQKIEETSNQKLNLKKKENNSSKEKQTENVANQDNAQSTKPAAGLNTEENSEIVRVTTFGSEEISPLFAKWPKYFFDAFSPVQPFPELQHEKSNQIPVKKVQNPNVDIYFTSPEKEKKGTPDTAGPQLNPLSIFDREFAEPIFD